MCLVLGFLDLEADAGFGKSAGAEGAVGLVVG
jgi:hypothetical protein